MKKLFLLLVAAAFAVRLFADCTVYYAGTYTKPYVYAWNSTGDAGAWPGKAMTATSYTFNGKTIWTYTFTTNYPNIIFNGNGSQTADLSTECGSIYDQAEDRWVEYSGTGNVVDTSKVEIPLTDLYGVPTECEDVMLQCFYWNSHNSTKYGCTQWQVLVKDTTDLASSFDLIWLPPSARSTGGVGYYSVQYSNQSSDWGSRARLKELIGGLHRNGAKVIGDIVVNHHQSNSGYCSFAQEDFGGYGQWQLTSEHICAGDEAFSDTKSNCKGSSSHGAEDTGTNDAGCRDLDHTSTYVQDFVKAYLSWMIDTMGYDGFRYDMVLGFHGRYLEMYNKSAQPYFSVGEYWESISKLKGYVKAAGYTTTCFDFPLKYKINETIGKGTYSALVNPANSLRHYGLSRFAVTFIDNHDTFERGAAYGNTEFIGEGVKIADYKTKIMQANAYILTMPGVPCVFYPHWAKFKDDIRPLIALRKAAGIHSESEVTNESGDSRQYTATITGHHGTLVLRIGVGRDTTCPVGFFRAVEGPNFDVYASSDVDFAPVLITAVENVEAAPEAGVRKEMRDGHMYILKDGATYDVMGRQVK